ncbi:unnamed protein product [Penicillium pancosmium]
MSIPPIAKATLQAAVINAGSNVLAQGIKAYRDQIPFEVDNTALMQFTTCALIVSPLGYLWLENLEAWFPSTKQVTEDKDKEKTTLADGKPGAKPRLNITNTIAKIVIDQVVGGAWNTVLFLATMGILRGLDPATIQSQIYSNIFTEWDEVEEGGKVVLIIPDILRSSAKEGRSRTRSVQDDPSSTCARFTMMQ